jgi:hypothetical protein
MMNKFNLTATFMLGVVLTPGLLIAASEVVIGYANISARGSPVWIAQEKRFDSASARARTCAGRFGE